MMGLPRPPCQLLANNGSKWHKPAAGHACSHKEMRGENAGPKGIVKRDAAKKGWTKNQMWVMLHGTPEEHGIDTREGMDEKPDVGHGDHHEGARAAPGPLREPAQPPAKNPVPAAQKKAGPAPGAAPVPHKRSAGRGKDQGGTHCSGPACAKQHGPEKRGRCVGPGLKNDYKDCNDGRKGSSRADHPS